MDGSDPNETVGVDDCVLLETYSTLPEDFFKENFVYNLRMRHRKDIIYVS